MSVNSIRAAGVFMLTALSAFCGTVSAAAPSFQGLGYLDLSLRTSGAGGISADGSTVIGTSLTDQGQEGFIWTSQTGMIGLGDFPPGSHYRTIPIAISGDGSLIGGYRGSVLDSLKPVIWDADRTVTELPSSVTSGQPPTIEYYGSVTDMSRDGSILTGILSQSRHFYSGLDWGKACYWDADRNLHVIELPVYAYQSEVRALSPDGSKMVIYAIGQSDSYMYIGSESTGFNLLPQVGMSPSRFSGDSHYLIGDQIVRGEGNVRHIYGFRWDGTGDVEILDPLDGFVQMMAGPSNADASMIGGAARMTPDSMDIHPFLWREGIGTQLLADVLTGTYGLDLDGWHLMGLTGISDDGTVLCGYGINPDGFEEAWVAVIPEPATLSLLIAGLITLRKKRRC